MAYKFKGIEKLIGLFVVFALILLISAIIFIAKGQKLIVAKNYYTTIFNSAENIKQGMPVKFKGLEMGYVKELRLNDENKIEVTFYVIRAYANRIKQDSVIKVNAPLIGEKVMEITEGSKEAAVAQKEALLYSIDTAKGRELLQQQISDQAMSPTDLVIQNVQLLTAQLSDPEGGLMKSLKNLEKFSSTFADTYGENKDTISSMIKDLEATTKNFRELSEALKKNPFFGGGWNRPQEQPKSKTTKTK